MTAEEKLELTNLIETVVDDTLNKRRDRNRRDWETERDKKEQQKVTKVYLITFPARVGFPEPDGRVVMHETAYARVRVYQDEVFSLGLNSLIEIIAHGDGRLLKTPMNTVLHTALSCVEVSEEILAKRTETAKA